LKTPELLSRVQISLTKEIVLASPAYFALILSTLPVDQLILPTIMLAPLLGQRPSSMLVLYVPAFPPLGQLSAYSSHAFYPLYVATIPHISIHTDEPTHGMRVLLSSPKLLNHKVRRVKMIQSVSIRRTSRTQSGLRPNGLSPRKSGFNLSHVETGRFNWRISPSIYYYCILSTKKIKSKSSRSQYECCGVSQTRLK
jgi:hypothetical protein